MSESSTISDGPDQPDRIARAVEREVTRRKRQVRVYLALLLVPVGMGAFAVLSGWGEESRLKTVEANLATVQPSIERIRALDTALIQVTSASTALQSTARDVVQLRQGQQAIEARLDSSVTVLRSSQLRLSAQTDSLRVQVKPQLKLLETALARVDQVRSELQAQNAQLERLEHRQVILQARQDSQLGAIRFNEDLKNRLQRLEVRSDSMNRQILRMRTVVPH
jgi:small-conductance mechanosensitive channel